MTVDTVNLTSAAAIHRAKELGVAFAAGAAARDRDRVLPVDQVRELARSGLLAITVPAAHGGAELSVETVAEVVRLISIGDPNLGQIPLSHFVYVNQLRLQGSRDQQARIFAEVLGGATIGNAQSERGSKHVRDFATTLTRRGDAWRLDGTKFYCTGAYFADWIPVLAHRGSDGPMHVAWVPRDADGLEIIDDWDAVGQRTTASGTVKLDGVRVTDDLITDYAETFTGPTTYGSYAQVLHAAIDTGIARAALRDAAGFVRDLSRPFADAVELHGAGRAADDPLVVQQLGEMELEVRIAESLLAEAARAVDAANAGLSEESAAAASLAVAAARVASSRSSVDVASRLFEVAGTRSVLAGEALDRHWRNARTHTLHDPTAWKVHHLGRWAVDGVRPRAQGQL